MPRRQHRSPARGLPGHRDRRDRPRSAAGPRRRRASARVERLLPDVDGEDRDAPRNATSCRVPAHVAEANDRDPVAELEAGPPHRIDEAADWFAEHMFGCEPQARAGGGRQPDDVFGVRRHIGRTRSPSCQARRHRPPARRCRRLLTKAPSAATGPVIRQGAGWRKCRTTSTRTTTSPGPGSGSGTLTSAEVR